MENKFTFSFEATLVTPAFLLFFFPLNVSEPQNRGLELLFPTLQFTASFKKNYTKNLF